MSSKPPTTAQVREALTAIIDPDLHRDIVSLGFLKKVAVEGQRVAVTIELTTPACPAKDRMKTQAEQLLADLPGVEQVEVTMTARVRSGQQQASPGGPATNPIPQVRNTIAVTSGKGGVGKSTVAVNLAVSLSQSGARVGLLDADVYGPSIPTMFGVPEDEKPTATTQDLINPVQRDGLKLMSIGFLVDREAAMIMRGPMLSKYVQEALLRVDWGELDYLVIDMPPGTGDVQLTLSQTIPLTGAVIVTTPQRVALDDVRRAVTMCEKLNVPILGLVENMSDPIGPDGQPIPMFGRGGGEAAATQWGLAFLGTVPLDAGVPVSGDGGQPIVAADAAAPAAVAYRDVAEQAAARLATLTAQGEGGQPSIRLVD